VVRTREPKNKVKKMTGSSGDTTFDIPKECLAGVVVNEGPDFRVEVKNVPVPEIGMSSWSMCKICPSGTKK
jgi:hypothetical protein